MATCAGRWFGHRLLRPECVTRWPVPAGKIHARHQSTGAKGGSGGSGRFYNNAFVAYIRRLKWVPIPVGVGVAYLCYQQFGRSLERERRKIATCTDPQELIATPLQVKLYRKMPLNVMSRLWGRFNQLVLPLWLRKPAIQLYVWLFDCKVEEAAVEDLTHYRNLNEFFRRALKPHVRPVDTSHSLTSPSDGKVLHFGKVNGNCIEQVKGVTYSLEAFMGPESWSTVASTTSESEHKLYVNDSSNELYHCVIYLAPGDYHRFHSPVDWNVTFRRHFPGDLLSVNPGIARWIQGLFNFNERAVYYGNWEHGFFSMAAVGATNVGSIKITFDENLETNCGCKWPAGTHFDHTFQHSDSGIQLRKGEPFGEFNLGSTIVLVFEAPKNFNFKIENGQKIKFGEPIGLVNN